MTYDVFASGGVEESTNREALRLLFVAALSGLINGPPPTFATDAGPRVYAPDDWPIQGPQIPAILVDTSDELKLSRGVMGGFPQFITTPSIVVVAYADGPSKERVKAKLDRLARQVELCILTCNAIIVVIQQFTQVRSSYEIKAEGQKHTGMAVLQFAMEFPQNYYPIPPAAPLENVVIDMDLTNRFDPTATYTEAQPGYDADFPNSAVPAPRASGPDGRNEARVQITLPQD